MYNKLTNYLAIAAIGLCLTGCGQSDDMNRKDGQSNTAFTHIKQAKAVLSPTKGNKVKGVVTLSEVEDGVKIVADFEGLTPGEHGFHVHEFGDCSAPDGSSAGAHYNPGNKRHGSPEDEDRHAGDLGNIVADAQGRAHYERVDEVIKLNGKDTVVGRSLIVHEKIDDFKTQPTGNSGGRLACGVIVKQE